MTQVRERMTIDPVLCDSNVTLTDVAQRMRDEDIGNVLVKAGGTFGIVTDRDIVVRAIAEGVAPESATVGDVMTADLSTVAPTDDLDDVIATMRDDDIRRVAVCEDGQPVGILSLGDLAVMRDERSVLADISAAEPNN